MRIATLAMAGLLVPASAEAALFWSEPEPAVTVRPARQMQPRRQKQKRIGEKLPAGKEAAKPQGPLVIAVSIERQTVKIYDANGLFAESPVSTGMRGHSTPMGVFSVIQKDKFHRSNIYSNAPMPYMQRVTWSGVAMHAGVLPGYPASHGCIRMPMAFAVKMWGWTRMGARVVITPGELSPADFTHPLLAFKNKPADVPVAAVEPVKQPASDLDKPLAKDSLSTAKADKSAIVADAVGVKTADASGTMAMNLVATSPSMSDASPATPATADAKPADEAKTDDVKIADDKPVEEKTADAKPVDNKPADEKPVEAAPKVADAPVADVTSEAKEIAAAPVVLDVAKEPAKDQTKDQGRPTDAGKPVVAETKPETKPDVKPEIKPEAKPEIAAATVAPKRPGQIAAFISRKDGKLYVRQNFAPLFDVPVTIAASDRPLGTHVFTARADKDDANVFHWSVVSMPAVARRAAERDEDARASRHRKIVSPIEIKSTPQPDSPSEALDRIGIPDDAKAMIAEALSTGGSLIVSDQGLNSGETGKGTDFIMSLR